MTILLPGCLDHCPEQKCYGTKSITPLTCAGYGRISINPGSLIQENFRKWQLTCLTNEETSHLTLHPPAILTMLPLNKGNAQGHSLLLPRYRYRKVSLLGPCITKQVNVMRLRNEFLNCAIKFTAPKRVIRQDEERTRRISKESWSGAAITLVRNEIIGVVNTVLNN